MSLGTGIRLAYLVAAICFIIALGGLSSPRRARVCEFSRRFAHRFQLGAVLLQLAPKPSCRR